MLGRAFGIEIDATYAIPALGAAVDAPTARRTVCRERSAHELERGWTDAESTRAVELRHPNGRLFMSIRHRPDRGYRIWAPRHGRHLVAPDGRQIWSALPQRAELAWQRLFFAQTLPLAAALQELELLHASAVELDGAAIAFTAASGSGKSSLASHLVAAGAGFLTDDVLALECADDHVLAHPGPARLSVAAHELRAMSPLGRSRLGRRVGATDKPHFEPPPVGGTPPLAVVYRVIRGGHGKRTEIREHVPPAPQIVFASSFLPYLQTSGRLLNQLATYAAVRRSVRLFDLEIPASVAAREAAAVAHEHARAVVA